MHAKRSVILAGMGITGILLMSILATGLGEQAGATGTKPDKVEVSGEQARAIAAAFGAFREKEPNADASDYSVRVSRDGSSYRVVFLPALAPGETPKAGGSTSLGREVSVWVKADGEVERTSFAR